MEKWKVGTHPANEFRDLTSFILKPEVKLMGSAYFVSSQERSAHNFLFIFVFVIFFVTSHALSLPCFFFIDKKLFPLSCFFYSQEIISPAFLPKFQENSDI